MIDFDNIWKDQQSEGLSIRVIDFQCDKCNTRYSEDSVNLAVFLYGFFSLQKKDLSYIGITCPSCINTILIKENRSPGSLFKKFASQWSIGERNMQPNLAYFTSIFQHDLVGHYLNPLGKHNISYFSTEMIEDGEKYIDDAMISHIDKNELHGHLSSFVDSESPFPSTEFFVLYVNEDRIEDLLIYEHDKKVRLIPRYFCRNHPIEQIEEFCAQYGFDNPIERMMGAARANFEDLKKNSEKNNLNLDKILSDNPNIQTPDFLKSLMQNMHQQRDIDFGATSNFMNILASDPNPWDLPGTIRDCIKEIRKRPHPFKDQEIPTYLESLNTTQTDGKATDTHKKMIDEIQSVFSKGYIQEFLSNQYPQFINEYRKIVNRYAFSYADVWQLKEQYLEKIYQCVLDKKATRPSYNHRQACRSVAKEIWSRKPDITIARMCASNEIRQACNNERYPKETLRKWIKDLCPDRSPGRRPKKRTK